MPSTTEALLDVNVLIAAVFEDHPEHAKANTFLSSLEHFYTCPTTQGGFLRFPLTAHFSNDPLYQPCSDTAAACLINCMLPGELCLGGCQSDERPDLAFALWFLVTICHQKRKHLSGRD